MISRRMFLRGAGGSALLAAGTAAYAVGVEPLWRLTVRQYTITSNTWQKDAPSLRIAALSDFHVANPWMTTRRIMSIAQAVMKLQPDLVVLLGDYMTGLSENWTWGPPPTIPQWTAALGTLSAPLGAFAILGNHDVEFDAIRAGFAAVNIPLLENATTKIGCNNYNFWLAGLGDRWQQRDDFAATISTITDDSPIILLAHEPDGFINFAKAERHVMLTLSGHTHGGQLGIPYVIDRLAHGYPYLYGQYEENGRHLVVSGGLGCTRIPVRFMRPPEVTMITVRDALPAA